ncbi:MAG: CCA tRNA nucleotidyltransferase [Alphaproteobacteria bacterium]|nr:CCA tRNA nucleotidyltransferase [Alphaproteobacteria bacterium SS10]
MPSDPLPNDRLLTEPLTGSIDLPGWATAGHVIAVFDAFAAAGAEARFVGGCVRDAVLGQEPSDIDLATAVEPEGVIKLLEAAGLKAIPTGIEHGTITALAQKEQGGGTVEITTLRRDVSTDGRHAEVAFSQSWREDAARRDFTINALNATRDGVLEDWTNGQADLKAGRVRFIGEASQRIAEDHLRILRFFRFHGRFAAGAPDVAAMEACIGQAALIEHLSGERIREELFRILGQASGASLIALMAGTGILKHALPVELSAECLAAADGHDAFPVTDAVLCLGISLPGDEGVRDQVADHLKLSNADRRRLTIMLRDMPDNLELAMHRLGVQAVTDRAWLDFATGRSPSSDLDGVLAAASTWQPVELPVNGQDLQALGLAPGPKLGEVLKALEMWWFDAGRAPGREATLVQAKHLIGQID